MAQIKRKMSTSDKVEARKTLSNRTQAQVQLTPQVGAELLWRDQIAVLEQKKFSSITQAFEALGELIVTSELPNASRKEKAEAKDFLVDLFQMDPEIENTVRKMLTVRGKEDE
jgi:hypothetical protein